MDSVIRGHHIYKDIWTSFVGEELQCQREVGNIHDIYAVSVVKTIRRRDTIVGHLPGQISTIIIMSFVFKKRRYYYMHCIW